jgi:ABC-type multidrug transport system ATPase subunit
MSESILNALINLFSIAAILNVEGVSQRGRKVIESFLRRYLDDELTYEYLKVFDNYLEFYHHELKSPQDVNISENISIISFQIVNVCRKIKKELLRDERIIVFVQLLEFINEDNIVTPEELNFVRTVAKTFNISDLEFGNIKAFVLARTIEHIEQDNILIIDNQIKEWEDTIAWFMSKGNKRPETILKKHIYRENLYGQIFILYIKSIHSFVFRYFGQLNLYIEGHKIVPERAYFLGTGAIIKGPNIESIYYSDVASKFLETEGKPGIVFTGQDVEFRFRKSEHGIRKFSFEEHSGHLVGILGGSGVGKTTLINILNGKLPPNSGKIRINGYDIYKFKNKLKGLIGFVPQDDLLIEELTVFQNLYYNAKLCFSDYSREEIIQAVEKILIDLDLQESKDLKVGNPLNKYISGGQRKRLNIGLELLREPFVLFIDEPTSGLSSSDSEKVIQLLKNQVMKGKLVIANIHQPSSDIFKMFDRLWILDKGGYPIYSGNPIDAVVYFKKISAHVNAAESECPKCGNVKPEQILHIIESKKINEYGIPLRERRISPDNWYKNYKEKIENKISIKEKTGILPESNFKIPKAFKQFVIYSIRNLLAKLTNKQYLIITLFEAPLLALILGYFSKYITANDYVFEDNKNLPVFLFMSIVVALFMGLTVSAEEIIRDRKILERESFLNLSRISYLNSKIIYLFGVSAIQTLSFVLLGNAILEIKGMIISFWAILFTTSCLGNIVGLNISSGFNSVITIYILVPLILVPQLLLGGAMIHFDNLHKNLTNKRYVPIVGDLMTTRWAYEAMIVQQFKNNKFEKLFYEFEQVTSTAAYYTSFWIPNLETKIDECKWNIEEDINPEQTIKNLGIIRNELTRLSQLHDLPPFEEQTRNLTPESFNPEIADEITSGVFYFIKMHFNELAQEANDGRDELYKRLTDSLGNEEVIKFRQNYCNDKIEEIVTNRNELRKIFEDEDQLIRKKDPIFMYPESNVGRAHFFSPVKIINERHIETIWFNLFIIWLTATVMYFTLLFDILRKVITYFESIRLRRDKS